MDQSASQSEQNNTRAASSTEADITKARRKTLREQLHPTICQLASNIENTWHSQLALSPYDTPTDLGYVEGALEGERLTIENSCYQTPQFRKLHLELAKVGKNLDILHCVMFPHAQFNLPILGIDIVAGRGQISAAIVDLSPVLAAASDELTDTGFSVAILPEEYEKRLSQIPPIQFGKPRDLPDWGDIFSKFCLFIRPESPQEEAEFLDQVTRYLFIHCQLACQSQPVETEATKASILAGQRHYCAQQQKNDKTRRILESAFGTEWADRYFRTMLFDVV
jgi:phycocyanobilin:ferredoxin oxidoreductase